MRNRVIETPVWALKTRLRCDGLSPAVRASCVEVAGVGSALQPASDGLDRGVDVDAGDDVVAVEKRSPGEDQQVCEAGVQERVVDGLGIAQLAQERARRATRRASRRRENWPTGSRSSSGRAGGVVAVRLTSPGRNTAHHSSWSGDSSTSTWSWPGKSHVNVPGVSS